LLKCFINISEGRLYLIYAIGRRKIRVAYQSEFKVIPERGHNFTSDQLKKVAKSSSFITPGFLVFWLFFGWPFYIVCLSNMPVIGPWLEKVDHTSEGPLVVVLSMIYIVIPLFLPFIINSIVKKRAVDALIANEITSNDSCSGVQQEKANWPWSDSKVIISQKNVYQKGFLSKSKVGHLVQKTLSDTAIHRGTIFSDKVGTIKTDFFGEPKSIFDNDGRTVGNIKKTWWTGRKIIVDEEGNEIGEFKD
jgi:hypothetical protein